MGARTKAEGTRTDALLSRARVNLISRTARVWSRLGRFLSQDLNIIVQWWITEVLKEAEADVASGEVLSVPELPASAERTIREVMVHALAQGYWLQHVYMQECRAAARGQRYRGRVSLADDTELDDEEIRRLLESLIKSAKVEADPAWHAVIPTDAVKWIEGYTPKLAGVLEKDILEKVRGVVRESMFTGSTLKQRMEALREADPKIRAMGKHRVEAIARTEVTRADSMGRLIDMKSNPDVLGVEFSAILDDRTTAMCRERHGLVMRMDDPRLPYNTPPLHVNCRSLLVSATVYEHPDGLLTSHEFDEIEPGTQRPEDIEVVRAVLEFDKNIVEKAQPPIPVVVPRVEVEKHPPFEKTVGQLPPPSPEPEIEDLPLPKLLPPDMGAELRDAFRDSPEFIQRAYKAYKDELQGLVRDKNAVVSRYYLQRRSIVLGQSEKRTTLPHEFGHFVDHYKGSGARGAMASNRGAFADAIKEERDNFRSYEQAEIKRRMKMREILAGEMGQNPGVSDIFNGLSSGNMGGRYYHEAEYWKIPGSIEEETFANLFQLYAQNDREGIDCINKFFPGIIKAFLKLLGEG